MLESKQCDVAILGGGIIGLSCALSLLRAGRQVVVIERNQIGNGASMGNCGTITPSHAPPLAEPGMMKKALGMMLRADSPFYIKPRFDPALWAWLARFAMRCNAKDYWRTARSKGAILKTSRQLLEQLIRDEALDCQFETSGTLYVNRDPRAFEKAMQLADDLRQLDLPVEVWDQARVQREEPALKLGVEGALFHPFDASLRPDQLCAALAQRVRELGGKILEQTEVVGFRCERGKIEHIQLSSAQKFSAREVVFAFGAWSPILGKQLQLQIPIQPGKGYSITYSRPSILPSRPLVLRERSVCVTTWADGFRLGSTMEFSGYDQTLNRTRLDALVRGASEYLFEPIGAEIKAQWYGWRPMTYDDLPIIGRSQSIQNLVLATGHGMMGVSMASATGDLVRYLVVGGEPALDPTPYSPARFSI